LRIASEKRGAKYRSRSAEWIEEFMRRAAATMSLLALVLVGLLGTPASATPPVRQTSHDVFDVNFGDQLCGFTLLAHVEQTVTLTTFFDAGGNPTSGLLTGPIFVTFTNADTGDTVRLAIPGPSFFDAEGNLTSGTGPWATFTSEGGFVWAAGNLVFDEFGNVTEITGTSISICDLLA
jgi:hypothetical protein